jgi:hypothetical protein
MIQYIVFIAAALIGLGLSIVIPGAVEDWKRKVRDEGFHAGHAKGCEDTIYDIRQGLARRNRALKSLVDNLEKQQRARRGLDIDETRSARRP